MPFALWETELCNKYFEHQPNSAKPLGEKNSFLYDHQQYQLISQLTVWSLKQKFQMKN